MSDVELTNARAYYSDVTIQFSSQSVKWSAFYDAFSVFCCYRYEQLNEMHVALEGKKVHATLN